MYYFLFSPNNSGTTVMSQYISDRYNCYLPPFGNYEGQMMPSVEDVMRKAAWDKTAVLPWREIKRSWDEALLNS
jgi:hypothetical protein